MPKPRPGEGRQQFVARCVPVLIHEGKGQDQAVAICYSLYRNSHSGPDEPGEPAGPDEDIKP